MIFTIKMENKKVIKKVKKPTTTTKKKGFVEYIKDNWKIILIILLLLFGVSKCTSSCNRGNQIDKLNYQIVQMDSIITSNGIEMEKMNIKLDDAKSSIDSYKGIATGNQRDLVDQITTLNSEKRELEEKLKKSNSENAKLKKRISELESEIEELNKKTDE